MRVAIGTLVGIGLLLACELRAARKYPATANALDASALAILFSTFYAAHALWSLIPLSAAFVLLALVATVAVLLAIRRDSIFIALLGLLGGFAAPALLSTGENRPVPLFLYLLLLNAGLARVAARRAWPVLSVLSLLFTTVYQWAWVIRFLTASQLPLSAAIFLAFPVVTTLSLLPASRRTGEPGARPAEALLAHTASVGAALPLLFTIYLAATTEYGRHFGVLFGMLLVVDAGLFAVSWRMRRWALHAVGALGTVLVFGTWVGNAYLSDAWPMIVAVHALFVAFYLLATPQTGAADATHDPWRHAQAAAPLLMAIPAALVAVEPATARPWILFTPMLALLALHAFVAMRRGIGWVYYLATFFGLVAQAAWSARYLGPPHVGDGLVLYAVFGLLHLGVPVVARRRNTPLGPPHAPGLVLLASLPLLVFVAHRVEGVAALWGLALLLAILNAGVFIEATSARTDWLTVAGGLLSWWVLLEWWNASAATVPLLAALSLVLGLGLVMFGGHAWAATRSPSGAQAGDASRFGPGHALGFVAFLFLAVVASDPARAVPPWPLFAVLALLALAVGAVAIVLGEAAWHTAGMVAAGSVLVIWAGANGSVPWPNVGIVAGLVLGVAALTWPRLRGTAPGRIGARGETVASSAGWTTSAIVGLLFGQGVVTAAGTHAGSPGIAVLVPAHVALLCALLVVAARETRHGAALVAVGTSAVAVFAWMAAHGGVQWWLQALLFALALYLVFVAYPLWLGEAAGASVDPYLAAVLAGIPFFVIARESLQTGGWSGSLGLLPIAQAALMAVLLRRAVSLERDHPSRGRIVLVAATALAFVTVAVPLQLRHQWVTISWALEGAALAWLFRRVPHRGLLWWSVSLLAIVFARLALNVSVLDYEPRGGLPILNWYLYTYLACAGALLFAARSFAASGDRDVARFSIPSWLYTAAGLLLFLLLNIEIADAFATGPTVVFRLGAGLAQDLTYTLGWLVFGLGLLAVGIFSRSHAARVAALGLITVTVVKGFLYDLSSLGGLYRVGSFVGLAVSLALVSIALQKYVLAKGARTP